MKRRVALGLLLALLVPGVGDARSPAITVSDAWSRPATEIAVVYAILRNDAALPDRLIGAASPLASHAGLHQTFTIAVPGMSPPPANVPMNGDLVSMKAVSSIPIPAHGTTMLAPGGYHLMLELRHDLRPGETIPLRLHFARAGWIVTRAQVRPIR
ncbi:MAG: copper chaperone PCu(A)C [Candidatus Velthaea sp.]|jgi:copper(I)-binding protein